MTGHQPTTRTPLRNTSSATALRQWPRSLRGVFGLVPKAHPLSWWILLISTLAIWLNAIDRVLLPTLMPAIMREFRLNEVQAGWLNSLSFVGTFSGAIILGIYSDYLGGGYRRCRSWAIAVSVEVAAGVATAFCQTLGTLQALRVLMGFGSGGSEPINVALLGEWWQKEHRGFALGVHHTGFPLGQFIGPALIAGILLLGSWRQAFLFIPLIGLSILAAQLMVGNRHNHQKVCAWITANRLTPPLGAPALAVGQKPGLGASFACLRNRNCLLTMIVVFGFIWAELGIATFLTLQLMREVGMALSSAAMISGASGITGWVGQILWGAYSDVHGRKFSLAIILCGWIVAAALCVFIQSATLAWAILLFWGLFRNSPFPVAYALLIDSAPTAAASSMGLMVGLAVGIAGILVAPVTGWIIRDYGFTLHYGLIVGILLLCGIPLYFIRETVRRVSPARRGAG